MSSWQTLNSRCSPLSVNTYFAGDGQSLYTESRSQTIQGHSKCIQAHESALSTSSDSWYILEFTADDVVTGLSII